MANENNNDQKSGQQAGNQDQPKTGQQAGQQQKQAGQQGGKGEQEPAVDNDSDGKSAGSDKSR